MALDEEVQEWACRVGVAETRLEAFKAEGLLGGLFPQALQRECKQAVAKRQRPLPRVQDDPRT